MNPEDDPRGKLVPGTTSSSEEINELKSEMEDMRMQIDILKETINVIKKDPGVDQEVLRNREKAAIIGALKSKYPRPEDKKVLRKQGHAAANGAMQESDFSPAKSRRGAFRCRLSTWDMPSKILLKKEGRL